MDYRHLDEQIKFLVEAGVDNFADLYRVIGRDELENYRTSPIEESSRPLLHRLESICKYDTSYCLWEGKVDYEHPNCLSREAMSDIEVEEEYNEYRDSVVETIMNMIEYGLILYDRELGSYRRSDRHYEAYGIAQIQHRGISAKPFSDYPYDLQGFLNRILERKGIVSYDESRDKWGLRGVNPDYTWLDNMIVLKVIQGHNRLDKLWDVLGEEINERYPVIKWGRAYQGRPGSGSILIDQRLGVLYRSRKLGVNRETGNLEFLNVKSM